jgi:hypothetical protein
MARSLSQASATDGVANPYFEDEDVSTIVIKPLPKYTRHRPPLR